MSRTHFRVNLHSIAAWMSRTPCLKQVQYLKFSDSIRIQAHNHLVQTERSSIKQAGQFG